jgi:hypothetical protein
MESAKGSRHNGASSDIKIISRRPAHGESSGIRSGRRRPKAEIGGSLSGLKLAPTVSGAHEWRFDVLTTNVADLQVLLHSGRKTSVNLVNDYLDQIERHNIAGLEIRALISIAPRASLIKLARARDLEREQDYCRGPMHGIPVIVKVWITLRCEGLAALVNSSRIHSGLIRLCAWTLLAER